jgi:hypothetical protein
MAKSKRDKKLYGKLRDHGLRKSVARELSELPARVSNDKQAPKSLRESVERLEGIVQELKSHTTRGERQTAARRAARTRSQKAQDRSAAARKAARTRAAGSTRSRSGASATKSRTTASRSGSRAGASASKAQGAKSRSGGSAARSRARRSS